MAWRIAAASAVGTSHSRTNLPCQDSVNVQLLNTLDGAVLVCVVSDGAGSAAHSQLGSRMAAKTITKLVQNFLETDGGAVSLIQKEIALSWLSEVQMALGELAEEANSTVREFACTLLVAIIAERCAAFLQVGDGAMVTANELDDGWSYIFWPQHGEFANSTNFVTSSDASEALEFAIIDRRIERFASFSDGIENLVLHQATKSVHAPFFAAMLGPVEQSTTPGLDDELSDSLVKYLGSERVCERTDDDKTLILASRKTSEPQSVANVSSS